MAEDTDNPRTAQGLLPASMATASQGMASIVPPAQKTLGMTMYHRYNRAPYYLDYTQQAVAAAEANPYVDTANALAIEVQGLQKRADARRAELVAAARSAQAARAKLNAARLKAAGRGGGFDPKLFLDSIKTMGTIGGKLGELEEGRLTKSGVEEKVARLKAYGTEQGISEGARGAMVKAASIAGKQTGPSGMTPEQLDLIARDDAQGASSIRAAMTSTSDLERGNHAFMFARELERQGVDQARAEKFAADTFRVPPRLASEEGKRYVQSQMARDAQALIPAGEGEAELLKAEAMLNELQRFMLNQMGKGRGGAVQAEVRRQQVGQLTPKEDADLRLYLAALANDGIANLEEGETVLSGGREVALTPEQIAAGKVAYDKAKKHGTFRAEDAAWFDDEYLRLHKSGVERGALAEQKRLQAMSRAERTPEEVRREAAENFVRTATAARDLEDYVPLSLEGVTDPLQATVMGGASHIARREGAGVFDLGAHHPDRKRRLGGVGPIAQTPLRKAQEAFRLAGGTEGQPMKDADFAKATQALRNRFKRNPDKLEQSLQYLFAMQLVSTEQAAGRDTKPKTVETDLPPAAPPTTAAAERSEAASRADRIGAGREVADVDAFAADPPRPRPRASTARAAQGRPEHDLIQERLGVGRYREGAEALADADLFQERMGVGPYRADADPDLIQQRLGVGPYRADADPDLIQQRLRVGAYRPTGLTLDMLGSAAPSPQPITTNNGNRQPGRVLSDEEIMRARVAPTGMGAPIAGVVDAFGRLITSGVEQGAATGAAYGDTPVVFAP